jgi:hypothetical protein
MDDERVELNISNIRKERAALLKVLDAAREVVERSTREEPS